MSDVNELGKRFFELKQLAEAKKEEIKKINDEWSEVENELIQAMVDEGTNSIGIEGIGKFTLTTKSFLSVNKANEMRFYGYLRASDNGALIHDHVNPRTLGAFLKEHQKELEGKYIAEGLDAIDARNKAIDFLKEKGAAIFSEKTISLRKE